MQLEQRQSGLMVPAEKPERPARKHGPLELHQNREEVHRAFAMLLNLPEVCGRMHASKEVSDSRELVIRTAAKLLLGDDFDCEILT